MIKRFAHRMLRPVPFVPLAILAVSLIELAVADRKYGVFTGGFGQSTAVDNLPEMALFFSGYLASQIAVALLAWKICAWLNRRRGGWPIMVHFAFGYGGFSLATLNAQYQLHSYFSDAVGFALIKELGGGSIKEALLYSKNELAMGLVALTLIMLVWWACVRVAGRILGEPAGATRNLPKWRWIAASWLVLLGLLALIPRFGSTADAAQGLNRMLAWRATSNIAAQVSDFDQDGYGLFGLRLDNHPFDSARHPLALDIPGNGVDEDGYGGDLVLVPVPQPRPATLIAPAHPDTALPNVVLVVMESTRADVLGKRIDGKLVAPNLMAIAQQGTTLAPSYSHVAFTTASLKSIFSGRLAPHAGDPSLFSELKQSGYFISVFSGQAEDFGDISSTVAMRQNADVYRDGEILKDQRAFIFGAQGSLVVDEGVLLGEFDKYLGTAKDWQRPQFVYLNFQSPHFPYDHPGIPHVFANPPIARADISEANRGELARTYWNAVAHSDAELGKVVARLKQLGVWDNTILLVTGDHGEALFEDGFLGHGHIINDQQFATFMVSNRPVTSAKAPIAISDYRDILLELMGAPPRSHPHFAPFMHIGPLDAPSAIGTTDTPFGTISLRLDTGNACFARPAASCAAYARLDGARKQAIDALVARWGSERWAARQ